MASLRQTVYTNEEWERFFGKHVRELQKLHGERIPNSEKAERMVRLILEHLERLKKCQCPGDRIGLQYYHTMLYNLFTTLDMYTRGVQKYQSRRLDLFQVYMDLAREVRQKMDQNLPPASRVCTGIQQRNTELVELYRSEFSHNNGYSQEYESIQPAAPQPAARPQTGPLGVVTTNDVPYRVQPTNGQPRRL